MIHKCLPTIMVLFLSTAASASVGNGHVFMCNVVGFDTKQAVLACDPKKPKDRMTTPRKWMDQEAKLKSSTVVKFALNDEQFEEWLALNKSPIAKTNEKSQ